MKRRVALYLLIAFALTAGLPPAQAENVPHPVGPLPNTRQAPQAKTHARQPASKSRKPANQSSRTRKAKRPAPKRTAKNKHLRPSTAKGLLPPR